MRLDIHVVGRGDHSTNYGLDRQPKIKNVKYQFYHKHVKNAAYFYCNLGVTAEFPVTLSPLVEKGDHTVRSE